MNRDDLKQVALIASAVLERWSISERPERRRGDVPEVLLAKAFIFLYGGNSTLEQLRKAEEWARGADERVAEASMALDASGIGGVMTQIPGQPPQKTIADRIAVLAKQRDDAKALACRHVIQSAKEA